MASSILDFERKLGSTVLTGQHDKLLRRRVPVFVPSERAGSREVQEATSSGQADGDDDDNNNNNNNAAVDSFLFQTKSSATDPDATRPAAIALDFLQMTLHAWTTEGKPVAMHSAATRQPLPGVALQMLNFVLNFCLW